MNQLEIVVTDLKGARAQPPACASCERIQAAAIVAVEYVELQGGRVVFSSKELLCRQCVPVRMVAALQESWPCPAF